MMTTLVLLATVIVIEAVPIYGYLQATFLGLPVAVTPGMIIAFAAVVIICGLATVIPLRVGLRRMEQFEF